MGNERERRLTSGGGEAGGGLAWRLEQVEHHVKEQRELNGRVNEGLYALRSTMEKGLSDLGMSIGSTITEHGTKLTHLEEARAFWGKVALAVVTSVAIALIGFLARISWIVQGARSVSSP